jgi:hypothetical protein
MAKKSRMSILKRQREARKQEKAALKRGRREQRKTDGVQEPTQEDLAGYLTGVDEVVEEEPKSEQG